MKINKIWLIFGMVFLIGIVVSAGVNLTNFGSIKIFDNKSDALIERDSRLNAYEIAREKYVDEQYAKVSINEETCRINFYSEEVCFKLYSYEWNGETFTTDAPVENTREYIEDFFRQLYDKDNPIEDIYYNKATVTPKL